MAAATNSKKPPPHKPAKGPHPAGESPSITAKVKVRKNGEQCANVL